MVYSRDEANNIEINKKLDHIITTLESIKLNSQKMSNHIDFIDTVYNKVKSPMYWICDKINNNSLYTRYIKSKDSGVIDCNVSDTIHDINSQD